MTGSSLDLADVNCALPKGEIHHLCGILSAVPTRMPPYQTPPLAWHSRSPESAVFRVAHFASSRS
jgi:hypothetical protein